MPDAKISQLTSATALAGSEVAPVVQGGITKKATIDQILTPAAGKGIDFSANGGDVLTQYDEGTWAPVVTASSGAITSYTSSGSYTRVGRMVTATVNAKVTNAGTGGGALIVTLPFTSNAAQVYTCAGRDDNTGLAIQGRIPTETPTVLYILSYSNTSVVLTNTEVFVTITYFV